MISFQSMIQRKLVILPHYATIREAACAMSENQVGCALISAADGSAAGIVTDRDLGRYWANEAAEANRSVDEIMSQLLIAGDESMGLDDIVRLMETHGLRRIPLVGKDKTGTPRFTGIVSLDDLVAAQMLDTSTLSRIIRRQLGRRLLNLGRPHAVSTFADARSQARKKQTLSKFYQHIQKETGLSDDDTVPITHFLLGSLFMRVSLTSALHFSAQLPEMIRDTLINLPAGPDRSISVHSIAEELTSSFHVKESDAKTLFQTFIHALAAWLTPGQMDHLRAQLPEDFTPFFETAIPTRKAA